MKRVLSMIIAGSIIAVMFPTVTYGSEIVYYYDESGYEYFITDDDTVTIVAYYEGVGGGIVNVPETLHGRVVTKIDDYTFINCCATIPVNPIVITSVTIPDCVTSIGDWAFWYCDYMTIRCYENSSAHMYAVQKSIPYELIEVSQPETTEPPGEEPPDITTEPPEEETTPLETDTEPPVTSEPDPVYKRGHVLGNSKIGIGDALEILKYLAGMKCKVAKGTPEWNAACISGTPKPTINDALEIFKKLAKMKSKLD